MITKIQTICYRAFRLAESKLRYADLHNAKALDHRFVRETILAYRPLVQTPIVDYLISCRQKSPGFRHSLPVTGIGEKSLDPEQINGVNKFNLQIARRRKGAC